MMRIFLFFNEWGFNTPPLRLRTFDGAVLLLDLHDPRRPRLARGREGHAGLLLQTLLPEVVRAALVASPALGKLFKVR